ncbi:TOMM precursor leader peptide-binding protein [Ktedonosporobacter rubrisoli]|uniref:TOMM precursor leader peptide-binding protein n=1 Tax=Ktedonosporobacter rubrisoli TaxID=2509675 RepID=UPI0013EE5EF5|nr:TOMM precursor leader peptide-binding protein [Ktedonosporobacter rubrisoli]
MLELAHRTRMRIEITSITAASHECLSRIEQSLIERINTAGDLELPDDISGLTISLGILGMQDCEAIITEPAPAWKETPTYPLRFYRSQLVLGPLYNPARPDAPCPHCLERRWQSNQLKEEQTALRYSQQLQCIGNNPFVTPFAIESIWAIMIHAWRHKQAASPSGEYPFYVLNLKTLTTERYHLLKDSACPICTLLPADTPAAATIQLSARPKPDISAYRLVKATDYDLPLSGLINPISGLLGPAAVPDHLNPLVAPVSGTFHVRNRLTCLDASWGGHANSYHQSLYVGILEGLERYVGHASHSKLITVTDCYENLIPHALDPRECGVYEESFYQKHASLFVPFTPKLKIPWVWGYSFRHARPILVPAQLVYYLNHSNEHATFVKECSNGCATGSCMEEAIFYGLLELIERDAFMLIWYARLAPPRIDPRSCCQAETLFALEGIEKLGYDFYLFDMRLDVRIPLILGVAKLREPGLGNLVLAAGASLDPEDAVRAALCEVASYVPHSHRYVENSLEAVREMVHDYSQVTELRHHALLHGLPEMAKHSDFLFQNPCSRTLEETYRDWEKIRPHNRDLRDDALYCIDEIMKLGMDVIVVDQTSPEQARFGLRTASVIVPGLLPIDFGWQNARVAHLPRLRTVPRTAGYRETDFEIDLRSIVPHPFP